MELTALLQQLVAEIPHGLEIALAAINATRANKMSAQVLNNKLNPYYPADQLNESQTEAIIRVHNLYLQVSQFYASKANAVVFVLPAVSENRINVSEAFMDITRELGEACADYQTAYGDKQITRKEFKKIARGFDDVVSSVARAKAIVEAGVK
ncbi:phage regulatory CII family protein [Methylophilus sp. Leaf414]|uniref:phage regulatory CII family protein n=1 Tax=Methylophilus sp. Leaf414 TaxID=1736371 RepID=UPI0006F4B723|nr:phage regulatory CII family protein [Methylophilus sp. Leaf414]KQT37697.1 hypothetical protein ASG24_01490 [Methylophilus sp. Leaf414]